MNCRFQFSYPRACICAIWFRQKYEIGFLFVDKCQTAGASKQSRTIWMQLKTCCIEFCILSDVRRHTHTLHSERKRMRDPISIIHGKRRLPSCSRRSLTKLTSNRLWMDCTLHKYVRVAVSYFPNVNTQHHETSKCSHLIILLLYGVQLNFIIFLTRFFRWNKCDHNSEQRSSSYIVLSGRINERHFGFLFRKSVSMNKPIFFVSAAAAAAAVVCWVDFFFLPISFVASKNSVRHTDTEKMCRTMQLSKSHFAYEIQLHT